MGVGQDALQALVDDLLSEGHLLLGVPALPVPADHAVLGENGSVTSEAQSGSKPER